MGKNRFPIGLKFNHLTIIEYLGAGDDKNRHTRYKCRCDCGKEVNVLSQHIGKQKSCGCAPRDNSRFKSYNVSKEENMKLVREGAYETNSSSTHSLTMCLGSVYEDWKAGKLLYNEDEDKFYEVDSQELRDFYAKGVLESKCQYDWNTKLYSDGTTTYTAAELFDREHLDSVTDEEIEAYKEDEFYVSEFPCTYEEWERYRGDDYELYEQHSNFNGVEVVGFGYYGYD